MKHLRVNGLKICESIEVKLNSNSCADTFILCSRFVEDDAYLLRAEFGEAGHIWAGFRCQGQYLRFSILYNMYTAYMYSIHASTHTSIHMHINMHIFFNDILAIVGVSDF